MAATSLAIITSSFQPGPRAAPRDCGLWAAMNGVGRRGRRRCSAGSSPRRASWRWMLLINPPIGIAAALVAFRVVDDHRAQAE